MFTTGWNSTQDGGSGGDESVLIPARFVWPYGGRMVSLIGSFTRWAEYLPMTPLEGRPTVFQAIYKLSPGYHEYKFYVDGEWRHDENQPFVAGTYGIVNTVFLEPTVAILSNMEVDNSGNLPSLRSVVAVPGIAQEIAPVISEADIGASRHCISTFLSTRTAYDLFPDSGKVIMLDVNLPVKQAFHILYEQGIPVAPLWNSYKAQFDGMLSASDFILILMELGHGSSLTEEELETHTISAWKEGKWLLNGGLDGHCRPLQKHLIHAGPYESLKEVALKILLNGISTVPVIHSSAEDESFPQLLHLASLCGILKCICRYFRHSTSSLPILQQPICVFPLGTWVPKIGETNGRPLAILRPNASLGAALSLLVQAQVSSLPIVDENDSLLDVYSRSDITALAKDRAYAQICLDEMSIHQALQFRQDASSPYGFFNEQNCQMCLRTDSLLKVMERLSSPGVRRIIIVEAGSKRVEGIVSLRDIFNFLLG